MGHWVISTFDLLNVRAAGLHLCRPVKHVCMGQPLRTFATDGMSASPKSPWEMLTPGAGV